MNRNYKTLHSNSGTYESDFFLIELYTGQCKLYNLFDNFLPLVSIFGLFI